MLLMTIFAVAMVVGMAYVVMILWNWLIPDLFDGPTVDFYQALGLLALSKILTWGIGSGHKKHCGCGSSGNRKNWKSRFQQKLENMPPEKREKFKKHFAQKCGYMDFEEKEEPSEEKDSSSDA